MLFWLKSAAASAQIRTLQHGVLRDSGVSHLLPIATKQKSAAMRMSKSKGSSRGGRCRNCRNCSFSMSSGPIPPRWSFSCGDTQRAARYPSGGCGFLRRGRGGPCLPVLTERIRVCNLPAGEINGTHRLATCPWAFHLATERGLRGRVGRDSERH
jgi:hypothetical protein